MNKPRRWCLWCAPLHRLQDGMGFLFLKVFPEQGNQTPGLVRDGRSARDEGKRMGFPVLGNEP